MASVENTFYMCPANIFVTNMSSAYYVCRMYLIALETAFTMNANTLREQSDQDSFGLQYGPNQTAPCERSDLGSQCLQYRLQKYINR